MNINVVKDCDAVMAPLHWHRRRVLGMLGSAGLGLTVRGAGQKLQPPRPEVQYPRSRRGRELAEIARSLDVTRDIVYAERPGRTLRLDVYRPGVRVRQSLPAILSIGVAAWRGQDKDFALDLNDLPPEPLPFLYPPWLVPRGYIVVSAECRVSKEAIFPAPIHDCKTAVRWMREHAREFGIDPSRIGMMGASASGHLAAMLGVTTAPSDGLEDDTPLYPRQSSRVSAVYSYAGLYDFEYYERVPGDGSLRPQIRAFLGGSYEEMPDVYRRASPSNYVSARSAPFLLMHGRQDRRVPFEQQDYFARLLKGAGVSVEAISINNSAHAFIPGAKPDPPPIVTEKHIHRFFDRHLGQRSNNV